MIPESRLKEFGFHDYEKFPKHLSNHAVTLSLPSALDNGIEPLEVLIEDGLVIPLQSSASSGGMIIKRDGTMLHVGHRDVHDPHSPLESRFTKDIPYDTRVEVVNVMQRAVLLDPTLGDIWQEVSTSRSSWFNFSEGDGAVQKAGEFSDIGKAWAKIGELVDQLLKQFKGNPDLNRVGVKIIVQNAAEFKKGWRGEEIVVAETLLDVVADQGRVRFMLQELFPKMQTVLISPLFSSKSTFRLYYGSRQAYVIKLVVVPPSSQNYLWENSVGIDLSLEGL